MAKKMNKMAKNQMSVTGMPSLPYRSLHVEPAENGYIIRIYSNENGGKDKIILAKDEDAAKTVMMNMMGMANLVGHKEKGA